MSGRSSDVGSVPVPSKLPEGDQPRWADGGWQTEHVLDGDPLGEGGYGVVRRVRHLRSGELRALKEPVRDDPEVLARFKREIEVQSKVRHRHVMPVLEHGVAFTWFTMPLASRTLKDAAPEMTNEDLARAVVQVARGLAAAHERGYVHRDVKPWNILERQRGTDDLADWVIGDFGIVRRPEVETTSLKTVGVLGTAGFMAPEVLLAEHGKVTHLADIYSLGRTIAWATTGVRPEWITPLEAPWPWTQLVESMTAFQPGERPNGMTEVIDAIAAITMSLRAERARSWGTPPPPALSESEEALLARVFNLAWDQDTDEAEITVGIELLSKKWPTKATLRIGLRRLVQLGYLRFGWFHGEHEPIRSYTPTALAWDWATRNEAKIERILNPPPPAAPNDDIPF